MITTPDLSTIANWLNELNVAYYQREECSVLYLSYLQNLDGVAEAKIELIDDIMTISIMSEIKQSAISALLGELSQINKTTSLTKAYLDVNDHDTPKIIFSYTMQIAEGITFNQFSLSLASLEEEVLQIVMELASCDLLSNNEYFIDESNVHFPQTYH